MIKLREGRDIDDVKEALNLLILVCRDNSRMSRYEGNLLEMEDAVNQETVEQHD